MNAETFFDGVIDAVKNKRAMSRETTLGEARRSGGQQNGEAIVFVNLDLRFVRALSVQQPAVSKIRRK